MLLKIFRETVENSEKLEEEINRWIELNSNIRIERREHSIFTNPKTKASELIILIWYLD
jgi:hypothetical protein